MNSLQFLILEATDFVGRPSGGQSTFASRLAKVFPGQVGLVGVDTGDGPVGIWRTTKIDGIDYPFFAVRRHEISERRPLVPSRLSNLFNYWQHADAIRSIGVRRLFIQAPEILLVASGWGAMDICYRAPGLAPALERSRFFAPAWLSRMFERETAKRIARVSVFLATADQDELDAYLERQRGVVRRDSAVWFPTRFDSSLFFPRAGERQVRDSLGLVKATSLFVYCGRLNGRKGWDLLIDAFVIVARSIPEAHLLIVGDGEDRQRFEQYVCKQEIQKRVTAVGRASATMVAEYISAADVFVNASYFEGWPTSVVEALACGTPVVSTDVSGVRQMVKENISGFVVAGRDAQSFANAMISALGLNKEEASRAATAAVSSYSTDTLEQDLRAVWPSLSAR